LNSQKKDQQKTRKRLAKDQEKYQKNTSKRPDKYQKITRAVEKQENIKIPAKDQTNNRKLQEQ